MRDASFVALSPECARARVSLLGLAACPTTNRLISSQAPPDARRRRSKALCRHFRDTRRRLQTAHRTNDIIGTGLTPRAVYGPSLLQLTALLYAGERSSFWVFIEPFPPSRASLF
jgi:cytosine/adenosine deaminase-related metal-dependent hydrolase